MSKHIASFLLGLLIGAALCAAFVQFVLLAEIRDAVETCRGELRDTARDLRALEALGRSAGMTADPAVFGMLAKRVDDARMTLPQEPGHDHESNDGRESRSDRP